MPQACSALGDWFLAFLPPKALRAFGAAGVTVAVAAGTALVGLGVDATGVGVDSVTVAAGAATETRVSGFMMDRMMMVVVRPQWRSACWFARGMPPCFIYSYPVTHQPIISVIAPTAD
jgi:hypothetical protein